jgi:hypothetical protein
MREWKSQELILLVAALGISFINLDPVLAITEELEAVVEEVEVVGMVGKMDLEIIKDEEIEFKFLEVEEGFQAIQHNNIFLSQSQSLKV